MTARRFVVLPHMGAWAVAYLVPGTAMFSIEVVSLSQALAAELCAQLNGAAA